MISKRLARLIAILLIIPQATYGIALPQLPQQQHRKLSAGGTVALLTCQDTFNQPA